MTWLKFLELSILFTMVSVAGIHSTHIDIYLLSLEDGRRSLVQTTQSICERVAKKQFRISDITPHSVDTLLQGKTRAQYKQQNDLCAQWSWVFAKDSQGPKSADSKDYDQIRQMHRLIWIFTGCTCHFVGFVMFQLRYFTVMILSFRTDMPGQTVQTQIRLLEEQSDQGLHCLPFRLHPLDSLFYGRVT